MRLFTRGGIPMDECASALQKSIRRGKVFDSVFFAMELATKFHEYVWFRLETIAHEDVGLANPMAIVVVETCKRQYLEYRKKGKDMSLALVNAAAYLAMSQKTRMSDYLYNIMTIQAPETDIQVPDYALDMHTARGKQAGRGLDHFIKVAAIIENESPDPVLKQFNQLYLDTINNPYKSHYDPASPKTVTDLAEEDQRKLF